MNLLYLTQDTDTPKELGNLQEIIYPLCRAVYKRAGNVAYPKGILFFGESLISIKLGVTHRGIGLIDLDVLRTQGVTLSWLYTAPLGH
jgi:hypothetical protein